MRKSICGSTTTYYIYDYSGQRTRKISEKTGSIVEKRNYLGAYEVFRKYQSGTLNFERQTLHVDDGIKQFLHIETQTVEGGKVLKSVSSVQRYQYDNHLGSACLELSSTAAIISYEEYHPFGTTSYRSGVSEAEVSLKRYKYVGKERDEETGLYYYGARYYAAWLCRFVSVDPLQHSYPYLTPYNYAGNKPITHIDIDGMQGTGDSAVDNPTIMTDKGEIWGKNAISGKHQFVDPLSGVEVKANKPNTNPEWQNWLKNFGNDNYISLTNQIYQSYLNDYTPSQGGINKLVYSNELNNDVKSMLWGRAANDAMTSLRVSWASSKSGKESGLLFSYYYMQTISSKSEALLLLTGKTGELVAEWGLAIIALTQFKYGLSSATNSTKNEAPLVENFSTKGGLPKDAIGGEIIYNKNSPYLTVQKGDKTFHISSDRVKEYVKNPLNPSSRWGDQVNFKKYGVPEGSEIIKGAGKGHKRTPTEGELQMFKNYFK